MCRVTVDVGSTMRVSQWILLHTLPTSLSLLLKYRDQAKASEEGESHARVEHRWLGAMAALETSRIP